MSTVDLLAPATLEETLSFSQRLVRRRLPNRVERPADRRAHRRRAADDLEWLRSVRLVGGAGYNVTLIDLSEGGALVEVDGPLRPGIQLTLELAGGGLDAAVPLEVVRSYVARLKDNSTFYRGACRFAHPIDLPSTSPAPAPPKPFVGATAALRYLLDHCSEDGERVALARPDVLKVLASIHARGDADGGPVGRATLALLGAVLPALNGGSPQDAAAALQGCYRALPRDAQVDLREAAGTLETLIGRCFPGASLQGFPGPERAPRVEGASTSAMQKIVVRYADGELLKGFTQDFHPTRSQFSLWPTINASAADRVIVPMTRLKAVFFVRDFNGNPGYRERKTFTVCAQGRRIEVTFADSEVILGTTLNYRPDAQGFFVVPADAGGNNSRIYVIAGAVRQVRFI
jgi:Family of unknown function (DUF6982)/PilZ domain